jgi:hypothetical protein
MRQEEARRSKKTRLPRYCRLQIPMEMHFLLAASLPSWFVASGALSPRIIYHLPTGQAVACSIFPALIPVRSSPRSRAFQYEGLLLKQGTRRPFTLFQVCLPTAFHARRLVSCCAGQSPLSLADEGRFHFVISSSASAYQFLLGTLGRKIFINPCSFPSHRESTMMNDESVVHGSRFWTLKKVALHCH